MEEKFDCIIVGGGIAGLSAAMTLASAGKRFLLVERGEFCGAKNVSGGVLWGMDLARLVPEYWKEDSGIERFVNHRRLTLLDEQSSFSLDFKSRHFEEAPYSGVIVLRARFDNWLAAKVEEAIAESPHPDASFLATNILVEELIQSDGRVTGIRAGGDEFFADCVILAEGVNNLLTRQIGLEKDYVPADHVMVGVKEVIRFDRKVLEDRFQLEGASGMSTEFVGFASGGIEGGGFLYTNRESVSVGLVLGLRDLREKRAKPQDLLNDFKGHPAVRDMLRGGTEVEYSAHVVSDGDIRGLPREVYADGVLIAGEAAHLLLNAGRAIQGMDYAMRSGILAAETVVEAAERSDFSAESLKSYRDKLNESFIMKDMHRFQGAVGLLHDPMMYDVLPKIVGEFGRRFFSVDDAPTRKAYAMMRESAAAHSSFWKLLKFGYKAVRYL
ncbi:MAG: FAD-dependent oxidoreductase [Bacteroidota bacterium]